MGILDWLNDAGAVELGVGAIGLIGALLGAAAAVATQLLTNRAERRREDKRRAQALVDMQRADSTADVRALFESFVELIADIRRTDPKGDERRTDHTPAPELASSQATARKTRFSPWGSTAEQKWREIWTPDRESSLRARAELIPDAAIRKVIVPIVIFLDEAPVFASGTREPSMDLRELVGRLTAMGIKLLGRYLRHDSTGAPDPRSLKIREAYEAWEHAMGARGNSASPDAYTGAYAILAAALLPAEEFTRQAEQPSLKDMARQSDDAVVAPPTELEGA